MILDYKESGDTIDGVVAYHPDVQNYVIIDKETLEPLPNNLYIFYADDTIGVIRRYLHSYGFVLFAYESDPHTPIVFPSKVVGKHSGIDKPVCASWVEEPKNISIVRKENIDNG